MVTKLYYFRSKKDFMKWCREREYSLKACEAAWTGPGWYYARSKKHISKWVRHLDLRRRKKIGHGRWRHTHDLSWALQKLKKEARRQAQKARAKAKKIIKKAPKTRRESIARKVEQLTITKALARAAREAKGWTRNRQIRAIADALWEKIPKKYKRGKDRVWTYIAVLSLAKAIYEKAKERGVDPWQYDWEHLIDWSLGYQYAKELVAKHMGKTLEEIQREELERWKAAMKSLKDESQAAKKLEEEIDEEMRRVIEKDMEYFDDLVWSGGL